MLLLLLLAPNGLVAVLVLMAAAAVVFSLVAVVGPTPRCTGVTSCLRHHHCRRRVCCWRRWFRKCARCRGGRAAEIYGQVIHSALPVLFKAALSGLHGGELAFAGGRAGAKTTLQQHSRRADWWREQQVAERRAALFSGQLLAVAAAGGGADVRDTSGYAGG